MRGLSGRVAVVTGAARQRGIGWAIALTLADHGCDVVVSGAPRDPHTFPPHERDAGWRGVASVADEVRARGRASIAVDCDITDVASVRHLADATMEVFGRLDILVNNAGVPGAAGAEPILDCDDDAWRRAVEVNLNGLFLTTKYLGRLIRETSAAGAIVNISSLAGRMGLPNYGAYSSTKWAMVGFTQQLAGELAPVGIRVNCVCPGSTDTDMMDGTFERTDARYAFPANTTRANVIAKTPLGRQGEPHEIAAAVAFLASAESAFITGQTLNVDGGRRMD